MAAELPKVKISELATDPAPTLAGIAVPHTRNGQTWKVSGTALSTLIKADIASADAASDGISALIGLNAAGTGLVKANRFVLNVQDFGAGAAKTGEQNTAAFQSAIDEADSAGGGTILVPAGTYQMAGGLTGASNVHVLGFGSPVLKMAASPTYTTYRAVMEFVSKSGFSVNGIGFDSSEVTTFPGGYREIFCYHCSDYNVTGNTFTTPGAAIASLDGSNYIIAGNRITVNSSDGTAKHDGVIDNWEGCNNFLIFGNTIDGNDISRYSIIVTGQSTLAEADACHDFIIASNKVFNTKLVGIWVNGRNGVNYSFGVTDNIVADVSDAIGIRIEDVYDFTATGNKVRGTGSSGMLIGKEAAGYGTYGARDGFIGFNSVRDANQLSGTGEAGWAIASNNADNLNLTFFRNTVRGSLHTYAMGVRGSGVKVVGKDWDLGTSGTINNFGVNDSGTNTEKGWLAYSPTVSGLVNVSAASNTSTNYKFEDGYVSLSGRVSVTPTAAGSADTQVSISLPIASGFTNTADAIGIATTAFGLIGSISADGTNDYLVLRFPATNTGANWFNFQATYKVM